MSVRAESPKANVLQVKTGNGPPTVVRSTCDKVSDGASYDAPDGGPNPASDPVSRGALDYRRLFEADPTPCAVLTADAVLVEVNSAYEQVVGRSREELVGQRLADAFPGNPSVADADAVSAVEASLRRAAASGEPDTMAVQRHDLFDPATGTYAPRYWSPVTVPLVHEGATLLLHRTEDVTAYAHGLGAAAGVGASSGAVNLVARTQELEQVNRQLRDARDQLAEQALRDPLTGLLVRPVLLEATNSALARLRRHDHAVGMLFIDLDRL